MDESSRDIQAWNRIAPQYVQLIGGADVRIYPLLKTVLWEALGDLRGRSVLDVGCGHGWLAEALLAAGAQVVGIDGSSALLSTARQRCPTAEFIEWDLAKGLPPLEQHFDRVLSHMVLMDLPDIAPLIRSVRAALTAAGTFIFTIPHPCFFNYKSHRDADTGQMYCRVTGYLQPETWQIDSFGGHQHYHRSLTDYFETLRASRLAVTRLYEPPQIVADAAGDDFRTKIPKFMLLEASAIP